MMMGNSHDRAPPELRVTVANLSETPPAVEGGRYVRTPDEESLRNMRRQRDSEMHEELKSLKEENGKYQIVIVNMENEIANLKKDFESYRTQSASALEAAQTVANAGMVGKGIIYFIVSVTAAIGGVVAVSDLVKKWLGSN